MKKEKKKNSISVCRHNKLLWGILCLMSMVLLLQMVGFYNLKKDFVYSGESDFVSDVSDTGNIEEADEMTALIFSFISKLGESRENDRLQKENLDGISAFFNSDEFRVLGLSVELENSDQLGFDYLIMDGALGHGAIFMRISMDYTGKLDVESYNGKFDHGKDDTYVEFVDKFEEYIVDALPLFREETADVYSVLAKLEGEVFQSEPIQSVLNEKHLSVLTRVENLESFTYALKHPLNGVMVNLKVSKSDASLSLNDEPFEISDLVDLLGKIDVRNDLQLLIDSRKDELERLTVDPGFLKVLKDSDFVLGELNEEEVRVMLPLLDLDGRLVTSIFLDKVTGEIGIEFPDGKLGSPSEMIEELSVKKKILNLPDNLSAYGGIEEAPDRMNLLLLGKNGMNVDTIMFASLDSSKRTITLLSIPRDLYQDDRKINSVYADFGIREMVHRLESILGQRVDRYILIDMYAFKDMVDLIGGVTVTLEEDLVDPTYKVCEGEVCTTLYYQAGTYDLNGTEALRIARSRHTTSDYSRAERQQLIIEAMKAKILGFGVKDAGKVVKLIETAISATETDIKPDEALAYFFRYKDFNVKRGIVISSGNVLVSEKIPVDYVTSLRIDECKKTDVGCEPQYAIYALKPRDDNWNVIRWFVSNALGS